MMLQCQPWRPVRQQGGGLRSGSWRGPGRRQGALVQAAAAPEGGKPPSSRRVRSSGLGQQPELQGAPLLEARYASAAGGGLVAQPSGEQQQSVGGEGSEDEAEAAAAAAAAAGEPEPGSWEDWMRYFYAMDDVVHDLDALHADLEEAVAAEDYRTAAALKKQQDALEEADCLGEALEELEAAVAEERFADAARLRDESGVGLSGWWVGRGTGDSLGHLLRVTPDFGRWVGQVYTPRDLTDLLPNQQSQSPLQAAAQSLLDNPAFSGTAVDAARLLGEEGAALAAAGPPRPDDLGLPVMELFLRRVEHASGDAGAGAGGASPSGSSGHRYEQQAVALYAPDAALMDAQEEEESVASTLAEFIATDAGSSIVSVEKGRNEDGSAYVKIEIGGSQPGDSEDDEGDLGMGGAELADDAELAMMDDDDIRTIDDLAASLGVDLEEDEVDDLEALTQQQQPEADGSPSASASGASSFRINLSGADLSQSADLLQEGEAEQLARWRAQAAAAESAISSSGFAAASGSGSSLQDEVDAVAEALLQRGGGGGTGDGYLPGAEELSPRPQQRWEEEEGEGQQERQAGEVEAEALSAARAFGCMLQRAPAQLSWEGRDCFTVTVSEPPAMVRARQQQQQREEEDAARQAAAATPQLQRPPVRIIYDGKEQQQQQRRKRPQAGDGSPESTGDSTSNPSSASGGGVSPDGSMDVEVTSEDGGGDSEEISVLLSQQQARARQLQREREQGMQDPQDPQPKAPQQPSFQQQQQQQAGGEGAGPGSSGLQDSVAEDSAALAEQIEALREDFEAGRKPSKDQLNEIARRAMGLAIAQGISSANAAGEALADRWALEGRTTYTRLQLSQLIKTDPFSGLYVGTFGPHGPELLQVSREMEGGREWAVATKLTGDPNVPAGSVSWKAAIGKSNRLPVEMYPAEMAVTARYRGQGQVAQAGFTNAKWVEGELLVFGGDSPFVRGAQLGFTFDVRANQRYLIVLHRVNLEELFAEDDE